MSCRTCGPRCHNARLPACDCWCAGRFHGAGGQAAREAFCAAFGGEAIPRQPDPQSLFWSRAIAAADAVHARRRLAELENLNAAHPKGAPRGIP